jgi:hypothetical protein
MRIGTRLARAKCTLLSRLGSTSRATDGEHVFWAEFFFHHKPAPTKAGQLEQRRLWTVYALLTMDMGRFCRKALISALFICKQPL